MTEKETRTFKFSDNTGDFFVNVWCDGREYDAVTETYHPVYSYKITGPEWEYTANDIRGAANELPSSTAASQSLFAFLYACQEGMASTGRFAGQNENADLFPPHVRAWAYIFADDIEIIYEGLVKEVNDGQR